MNLADIKVGSPYLWNSENYEKVAVHVTQIYGEIVHFTVDGGDSARQVIDHPILKDGYFSVSERFTKRPGRQARLAKVIRETTPEIVKSTVREVPGIGKVAVVTPETTHAVAEGYRKVQETRKRRMSLNTALSVAREMADRNPTHFKWAQPGGEVETF